MQGYNHQVPAASPSVAWICHSSVFPQVHQSKGKEQAGSAYTQLALIRTHTTAEQESKTRPCGPISVAGYGEAVPVSFII